MDDLEEIFSSVKSQLEQIPGVTRQEANVAAQVLVFTDGLKGRTPREEMLMASLYKKLVSQEPDFTVAYRAVSEGINELVELILSRVTSISHLEAVEIVATILINVPQLLAQSSDAMQEFDKVIKEIRCQITTK